MTLSEALKRQQEAIKALIVADGVLKNVLNQHKKPKLKIVK